MTRSRFEIARKIDSRLVVEGKLLLLTPTQLGGDDPLGASDQPLLRNHDGRPYLPGTTLAGLLRAHLARGLGARSKEGKEVSWLFGSRWGATDEPQSPLIVDDACLHDECPGVGEMRDCNAVDDRMGATADKLKFDVELLPAGCIFNLRFEVCIQKNNPQALWGVGAFLALLRSLEGERISIGGRSRRGYGRCRAEGKWTWVLYDTKSPTGLLAWLGAEGGVPEDWPSESSSIPQTSAELGDALISRGIPFSEVILKEPPRMTVEIEADIESSVLIRSEGFGEGDADAIHIRKAAPDGTPSPGPGVVPGTSLGGVLRGRAMKIAKTIAGIGNESKAKTLVEGMFGPGMNASPRSEPRASKVSVREEMLDGGSILRHSRISIEPWTQEPRKGLLFDADAPYGSRLTLHVELESPTDPEVGLALCLVKDIFLGDLPIGGESSGGRGILLGRSAKILIPGSNGTELRLTGGGRDAWGSMAISRESKVWAVDTNRYLDAFHDQLNPAGI